jgi:thiosulfate/3-mercaptopyruvate sulfurtransferase
MSYVHPEAIVSSQWLADHLAAPDVRVVDATYFAAGGGKDGYGEYVRQHIPGAVYFDIDEIADATSSLPHMLPEAAKFASKVRKLGLDNGNRIVIYDRANGGSAAARVWWMFRVFGHTDVSVLDGGMAKWLREARPVDDLPPMPRERHFMPRVNQLLVRDKEQMKSNLDSRREQVVDARSGGRFAGTEAEVWPCKKVGHIPGSANLPWGELLDSQSGTFLPAEVLAGRFAKAGIDLAKPVVATCGSGVTACVLALGLYLLGNREAAVYDGSWAEWGLAEDTPAVVG